MVLRAEDKLGKSALCGVNVDEDELKLIAEKMGCSVEKMPFLYLGLPLGGIQDRLLFGSTRLIKCKEKLEKWRRFNLSRGGRATLCQSRIGQSPHMSLFAIPVNVASSLERLMRNFFWEWHTSCRGSFQTAAYHPQYAHCDGFLENVLA
ncbi:uncharacterized protein E6C27_scaffold133G00790 [Cucumis melo var. makuwa]|uniref:Uncharacterized protein n=1 Tax=Cucumis melo var. makuwa TaxID=1194695 RepID=A0A5A7U2D4_CUCMM|nr:uncharacterized protein E6C27_scaffold133G00790 [Cucumis melo var. makuwa]